MATKASQVKVGTLGVASWALIILSLSLTTPANLKPPGVTVWFLVLMVALSSVVALLLDTIKRLFGPKKPEGRSFKPSQRQGVIVGIWLSIILALSSLRQLSLRDVFITGLIAIIIELYLRLTT